MCYVLYTQELNVNVVSIRVIACIPLIAVTHASVGVVIEGTLYPNIVEFVVAYSMICSYNPTFSNVNGQLLIDAWYILLLQLL